MAGATWRGSAAKGEVGVVTTMGRRADAATRRDGLTWVRCWYVDCDVPRCEIDRKLTKFLLNLYKQRGSRTSEQKHNLNHKNGVMDPQSISRFESVYRPRTL